MSRYSDRYDDREGPAKLYVGRLSSRTRSRDLEDLFRRYGRIREVNVKHDFAFIEFSDPRDADDAKNCLNNKVVDGSRIIVEFAKRGLRGPDGGREYVGRGPPPGTGKCYNCGNEGHWARDCKSGDRNDKFYRCGRRGHIEKKCHNSPRPSSRYNRHVSHSRSPSRDRHTSRSPIKNHRYSRSPKRVIRSPLNENRARSLSPSPGHKESQSHFPSPVVNHNLNALPRRRESGISRSITPLSGAENGK